MFKTLKGKISIVYFCLVLLIAVVGFASIANLFYLSRAIDGLLTSNYKSINAVNNMIEALERQDSAMLTYISVDRQKGIEQFSENGNTFTKWYNLEYNNITEAREKDFVGRIEKYYNNYNKLFYQLQEIRNTSGMEQATAFYNSTISPGFDKLKQELKGLSELNENAMLDKKNNATSNAQRSMYLVIILSSAAVIGGFLAARFFVNKFLSPVNKLTKSIRLVKEGDLNHQISVLSNDEIGELALEFNNMTRRLQDYEQSVLGQVIEEKNKTLAIVKSMTDPLIVLDANFKILLLNTECENFFDIKEEAVVNMHFLEAIRNGEIYDHISSILKTDSDYIEKIIHIKAKEDYFFNIVVTTTKDGAGSIKWIIVAFQDVTRLKKLERLKTDFIATVSHEFKTPLTSIAMGSSLLLEDGIGQLSREQKEVVRTIQEEGARLTGLVTDLLELTKIESDRAIFKMETCSIDNIIDTSCKHYYDRVQQKDMTLIYELEDGLPKVFADREKIIWAINNLISNAIKFTNAGDEICVSAYERGGMIHVSVKDTGMGIPPEYLEKIFDKFFQVRNHQSDIQGTGLGLSIVKEIVEAHGGKIWCESKLDVGSNFVFTLPISSEQVKV